MQASQKSWIDFILGGYFIFLGLTLIFILVVLTASKNHSFAALPSSTDAIRELFQTHDKNKDGLLDYDEFGNILKSWGVVLSTDDLEIACYAVDQDGDEKISEQEFLDWWESVQNFNSENCSPIV
jgi:Ca2+-binding EF-hand superfamily protein